MNILMSYVYISSQIITQMQSEVQSQISIL